MKFAESFYAILSKKSMERGWQTRFAESSGISQNALSKVISRKTKSPGIEIVSAIVDALGAEAFSASSTIKSSASLATCSRCQELEVENNRLKARIEGMLELASAQAAAQSKVEIDQRPHLQALAKGQAS